LVPWRNFFLCSHELSTKISKKNIHFKFFLGFIQNLYPLEIWLAFIAFQRLVA
jgi:hypothetical protein